MVDEKTLKEISEKIPIIINRQKNTYLDFKDFIEDILKPEEEYIKELYNLILPNNLDFERLVFKAYENSKLIPLIIQHYDDILDSINKDNKISENYLKLIYNTLNQSRIFQNLPNNLQSIRVWYDQVKNDDINFQNKNGFVNILYNLLTQTENIEKTEFLQLAQIYAFKYFSNPDKNFVIIGANGSGKSSFARNSKKVLDKNVAIIAAQKIFYLSNITSVSLGQSSRENLWAYQNDDKLCKNTNFTNIIQQDLQNVYKSLVEEQNASANKYFEDNKTGIKSERKETLLEKVLSTWNEILIHRQLVYKNGSLSVLIPGTSFKYDFMSLSDGEKAIFYYIAHVFLAKQDSFIIVDEPENHLNLALITRLWDRLEKERKDCRFIYLTHNLDFAASRINSEKLWMKDFTPPAQWNLEKLPSDENLPEILYMELLGSRKPILFCEGTKASLDYKLYTRLFPEYTIIPSEGHLQVINYTRAFNKSKTVHGNKAIGIIDGDFHTDLEKKAWLKDYIFCVEAQEVENILCDEELLKACYKHFYSNDEKLKEAKNMLFKTIKNNMDQQVVEYATQTINEYLKSNLIDKVKTQDELENKMNNLLNNSSQKIHDLITKRKLELGDIITRNDYELGIRKYNYKGLIGIIPTIIEKDYKDKIFIFLDENPSVLEILRNKYFSGINMLRDEV